MSVDLEIVECAGLSPIDSEVKFLLDLIEGTPVIVYQEGERFCLGTHFPSGLPLNEERRIENEQRLASQVWEKLRSVRPLTPDDLRDRRWRRHYELLAEMRRPGHDLRDRLQCLLNSIESAGGKVTLNSLKRPRLYWAPIPPSLDEKTATGMKEWRAEHERAWRELTRTANITPRDLGGRDWNKFQAWSDEAEFET